MPSPTLTFGSRCLIASDERVARVADRDEHGDRHAALSGRAVAGADGGVRRHVDVGVREDDHVVLRPAERLYALAVLRPALVDVARDRRRADEADRRDVRVLEDRVDRDLVSLDDVEDAVREAGLLEDLRRQDRGGRVLLGRLEQERVAARDRRRPHPHGNHHREVEGRDPRDHPERLPDRVDVDPVAACSEKPPLRSVGIPQTYSMTSIPRCTSPCASESTLPCSAVSARAKSSRRSSRAGRCGRRDRPASRATRCATRRQLPSRSRLRDRSPRRSRSRPRPSAPRSPGCRPGPDRPEVPRTASPPIQCPIVFRSVVTAAFICAHLPWASLPFGQAYRSV